MFLSFDKGRPWFLLVICASLRMLAVAQQERGQQPQRVQMASLHPEQQLRWQRISPTPQHPDGPVLYQILLNASGVAGAVPVFDTNPRHLTNSPITVSGGNVVIGGNNGLVINGSNGLVTFNSGQVFPGATGVNSVSAGNAFIVIGGTPLNPTVGLNTANTDLRYLQLSGGVMSGNITFAAGQTFPASGLPNLAGEVTGPPGNTVVSNAVAANTALDIVRRDDSGSFSAGTVFLNGSLALPDTTSPSVGVIALNGAPFLHSFGVQNTFVGSSAGNFSMSGAGNAALGTFALGTNTTGAANAAFGALALRDNSTGNYNTAVGSNALFFNTTGQGNSGFGSYALTNNTTATANTAVGAFALQANTTGFENNAFGYGALYSNTTGGNNAAFGLHALNFNTTGNSNMAFGGFALGSLTSGSTNIAIGDEAGSNLTTGSNNIYINHLGVASESNTTRIGNTSTTAAFITGISGATSASGVAVLVNTSGQLGTILSSQRYKEQIADLGPESDVLMKLRPVAFYYKTEYDETRTRQYGLVAEEVAQIAPGLVVFDQDGKPQTVRYHFVNAMLLNEVQKQRRLIEAQQSENAAQKQQMQAMQEQMETLRQQNAAMQEQMKTVMLRLTAMEKSREPNNTPQLALAQQERQLPATYLFPELFGEPTSKSLHAPPGPKN